MAMTRRDVLWVGGGVATLLATPAVLRNFAPAEAHGPTRQRSNQSVDVARPPERVWALVGDFDAIARWHPAVASSPATRGNEIGSVRRLTLRAPGDPSFEEELTRHEPATRLYAYRILAVDPKVLPVNTYSSTFEVKSGPDGGSTVEWRSAFYRSFMNNDPPPDQNDAAAVRAIAGVQRAGLDSIKRIAESQA